MPDRGDGRADALGSCALHCRERLLWPRALRCARLTRPPLALRLRLPALQLLQPAGDETALLNWGLEVTCESA